MANEKTRKTNKPEKIPPVLKAEKINNKKTGNTQASELIPYATPNKKNDVRESLIVLESFSRYKIRFSKNQKIPKIIRIPPIKGKNCIKIFFICLPTKETTTPIPPKKDMNPAEAKPPNFSPRKTPSALLISSSSLPKKYER